jgi:hypothetical protein
MISELHLILLDSDSLIDYVKFQDVILTDLGEGIGRYRLKRIGSRGIPSICLEGENEGSDSSEVMATCHLGNNNKHPLARAIPNMKR